MKKLFQFLIIASLLTPLFASAHVKWFVHDVVILARSYQLTDVPVMLWMAVVLIIIAVGIFLEKTLSSPRKFSHPFFDYIDPIVVSFFSMLTGFGLVMFSFQGYIFAPTFLVSAPFGYFLEFFQMVIGFGFLLGMFVEVLSFALIALYCASMAYFGIENMLEALEIPGIALMLLFSVRSHWVLFGSPRFEALSRRYHDYSVPLLRMFTGLNFIVLGFSEKIFHPELGIAFLHEYHWNFMQMLGFLNFSDYWFVLSAGAVQILFGIVFVFGIVTRINAAVVSLFFITSLILLGPFEVFAHILHFAILMVLLVFGSGAKLKLLPSFAPTRA